MILDKDELKRKILSWKSLVLVLLFSQCIYYGYHNIIFLEPQSQHIWRQSDCASFAWHYATRTTNFFKPGVNNMAPNATGEVATEFPIIYYISGMIYRVIGIQPAVHRLINIALVLWGLFSLSKFLSGILRNRFWSIYIPMLIFSSPLLVFYTNNFLPDLPAFAFCLSAVYHFFRYTQSTSIKDYGLALFLFTMAALLKFSFILVFISLISLFLLEQFPFGRKVISIDQNQLFLHSRRLHILSFLGIFALIFSWYIYASWYSTQSIFGHWTAIVDPVYGNTWESSWGRALLIIKTLGKSFYLHPISLYLNIGLALCLLLGLGKISGLARISFLLLLLGACAYLSSFLKLIIGHNYYLIPLFLSLIPLYIFGAHWVENQVKSSRIKQGIYLGLIIFLGVNIYNAKVHMQVRYYDRGMHYKEHPALYTEGFRNYLTEVGVQKEDLVISYPDPSMNNTLYLMRRRGWSSLGIARIHATFVTHIKYAGAKYLILNDTTFRTDSLLVPVLNDRIGSYEGVDIYDLSGVSW